MILCNYLGAQVHVFPGKLSSNRLAHNPAYKPHPPPNQGIHSQQQTDIGHKSLCTLASRQDLFCGSRAPWGIRLKLNLAEVTPLLCPLQLHSLPLLRAQPQSVSSSVCISSSASWDPSLRQNPSLCLGPRRRHCLLNDVYNV